MKIAVVGGGFCGVAVAWHLSQEEGVRVDLFDGQGLGGGASGVAAGLLHPYPGEEGRRSWKASEAMEETLALIDVAEAALGKKVADRSGIVRVGKIAELYEDVEPLEEGKFLIKSGVTVYPRLYLEGVWRAATASGARFFQEKIEDLSALSSYDRVVLAAGAGIFDFSEASHLRIGKVKGQALLAKLPSNALPIERSVVAKGYIALAEDPQLFYAGSTYERGAQDCSPCLETALGVLQPKIEALLPGFTPDLVTECRAGVRVNRHGHYIPLIERLNEQCYAITAMGSRGLLYHAYFAKLLKPELLNKGANI